MLDGVRGTEKDPCVHHTQPSPPGPFPLQALFLPWAQLFWALLQLTDRTALVSGILSLRLVVLPLFPVPRLSPSLLMASATFPTVSRTVSLVPSCHPLAISPNSSMALPPRLLLPPAWACLPPCSNLTTIKRKREGKAPVGFLQGTEAFRPLDQPRAGPPPCRSLPFLSS